MNSWTRKLRMGMVGGGQGAFIGSVHRIAAALDGQAELVAGVFSRDWANTQATGAQLYLDPAEAIQDLRGNGGSRSRASSRSPHRFRRHRHAQQRALRSGEGVPGGRHSRRVRQAARLHDRGSRVAGTNSREDGTGLCAHPQLHRLPSRPPCAAASFNRARWGSSAKSSSNTCRTGSSSRRRSADRNRRRGGSTLPSRESAAPSATSARTRSTSPNTSPCDRVTMIAADKSTFLPDRTLDEDINALLRFQGGGKGVLTVSQIATGEENGLRLRGVRIQRRDFVGAGKSELSRGVSSRQAARNAEPRPDRVPRSGSHESDAHPVGPPRGLLRGVREYLCGGDRGDPSPHRRRADETFRVRIPHRARRASRHAFIYKGIESAGANGAWMEL